jgi:hypothetical protein
MADDAVKIRVELDKQTLGQTQEQIKSLRVALKDMVPGTPEFAETNAQIQSMNTRLGELTGRGETFKQSVQGMRQEARLFRFALMELMQGAEGMAVSIGALTGASQDSQKAMKAFASEATAALSAGLGMSFALQMMGAGAAAGPVGIAIGGITLLGEVVGALNDRLMKADATALELTHSLGLVSNAAYLAQLKIEAGRLKENITAAATPSWISSIHTGLGLDFLLGNWEAKSTVTNIQEATNAYNAQMLKIKNVEADMAKDEKKRQDDKLKAEKEYWEYVNEKLLDYTLKYQAFGGGEAKPGVTTLKTGPIPILPVPNTPEMQRANQTLAAGVPTDMKKYAVELEVVSSAFQNIGNMIQINFIEKMIQSKNVFEQFTGAVISGLEQFAAKMAVMAAIAAIMSIITGGSFSKMAGVIGMTGFAKGTIPTAGGEGMEGRIQPILRGGGMALQIVPGELKVKGSDLYYSVRMEKINYGRRGGRS